MSNQLGAPFGIVFSVALVIFNISEGLTLLVSGGFVTYVCACIGIFSIAGHIVSLYLFIIYLDKKAYKTISCLYLGFP